MFKYFKLCSHITSFLRIYHGMYISQAFIWITSQHGKPPKIQTYNLTFLNYDVWVQMLGNFHNFDINTAPCMFGCRLQTNHMHKWIINSYIVYIMFEMTRSADFKTPGMLYMIYICFNRIGDMLSLEVKFGFIIRTWNKDRPVKNEMVLHL